MPYDFPESVKLTDRLDPGGENTLTRSLARVGEAVGDASIRVLALSGGGSGVAFGAGAVVGWSRSGTRPYSQMFTQVSADTLLALSAFLGPRAAIDGLNAS